MLKDWVPTTKAQWATLILWPLATILSIQMFATVGPVTVQYIAAMRQLSADVRALEATIAATADSTRRAGGK